MLQISKRLAGRVALLASAGIAGALVVCAPMSATAAGTTTTVDFNSSATAADYPSLAPVGSGAGVLWAPFTDLSGLNAPGISGETNWITREGWLGHNYVVQADGGDNALWVQKAEGGCQDSGIQVVTLANGRSLISAGHTAITASVWTADAGTDVQATITDLYGGHAVTKTVTAARAGTYNGLTFDFGNATTGSLVAGYSYARMTLVFDPANAKAGNGHDYWDNNCTDTGATVSKLYKVDDISFSSSAATAPVVGDKPHLLTFDDNDALGIQAVGEASNVKWAGVFGGAGSGNVVPSGGAASSAHAGKALEFNKGSGNAWSGINLVQAPGGVNTSGEIFTSSNYKTISFDYYSPTASPVQLKLMASDGSAAIKVFVATAGWQTLSVDMSTVGDWSASKQYTKMVVYPGFADVVPDGSTNAGANSAIYYIDNVNINGYGLASAGSAVAVTGLAKKASRLTVSAGNWTGNGTTLAYKWYRCTVVGATAKATAPVTADRCTVIAGATANTYLLGTADAGKYIRGQITATTSAGSVIALSRTTAKVS